MPTVQARRRRFTASVFYLFLLCKLLVEVLLNFEVDWIFGEPFNLNVHQVMLGTILKKKLGLIWANLSKAVFADIWFEQNQRIFHNKEMY